ncbi:hypothetical protein DOTSEDRAFT_75290 [Dothistroma septosporum NZE10]|uniref:Protein BIG1 n=1 Tax=Dothistroma septosporum (strain NZE10 / CBS 128990) TaxID=675120 RepID=M2YL35_DOTSN|nr:hypothetical protein DOTSEDRAFT_75290 [Dothistroma septosporum NZE10]
MKSSILPLLLAARTAYALRDASPFVLLSTAPIDQMSLHSQQLTTSSSLEDTLISSIPCDVSRHIFLEQAGVHSHDLTKGSMPHMQRRISDSKTYKGIVEIPQVVGAIDVQRIASGLRERCNRDQAGEEDILRLQSLVGEESVQTRRETVKGADEMIQTMLHGMSNQTSHVLVYVGGSVAETEGEGYEMDEPPFHENLHTDLKRDVNGGERRRQTKEQDDFQRDLPLFEKYQFLSPGIFMGLTVALLLFVILYVGISAIAGLEVSYMAFSKEMGPQAQKKQQ